MSMDCEMLGALLSERRRGELSAEQSKTLESHLAGCPRCRDEAAALESVLEMVELPPISPAELEALNVRPPESPGRISARRGWQLPAVLLAAAAAAIFTLSIRPAPHRPGRADPVSVTPAVSGVGVLPGSSQELFPEIGTDSADETGNTLDDDVMSLEGPGLFGNLDG
jgi:predicted anti-sigma-YlaC factor YlaD